MAYLNTLSALAVPPQVNLENSNNRKPTSSEAMSSLLMDKLYSKANQMKSWNDISKSIKQSILEKKPIITDNNDRFQLQRCLDTIQKNIEVKSIQSLVERLESICRQLKLKFCLNNNDCFVYSDMYYVEIKLDIDSGRVIDCKVDQHQPETKSCPELVDVLQRGDFAEFTKHLEGLSAIYQIDTDQQTKQKAYSALHSLEKDLVSLDTVQKKNINDINNLVHKSPLGVLEPRKGGHSMKLTFFVPPYDLIDLKSKTSLPLTVDTIKEHKLGYSVTVCIEASSVTHKLQIESLLTVKTTDGKNPLPQFSMHSSSNATSLPACFVLKLEKPLPICHELAQNICKKTGIEFPNIHSKSNLIDLLAKQLFPNYNHHQSASFCAELPGQNHCYYVNGSPENIDGILIDKIPFTHPTHVPQILIFLRQQVLFNVILGSIIRQFKKTDPNSYIFEISYSGLSNIYVQFENPIEQSLATVDIDLKDITNVKCKLYPNVLNNICSDDFVSKIMQKSLSIPVTMRSIINRTRDSMTKSNENQVKKDSTSASNFAYTDANNELNSTNTTNKSDFPASNSLIDKGNLNKQKSNLQSLLFQQFNSQFNKNFNPNLTVSQQKQLLNHFKSKSQPSGGNTMLMSMLSDVPHASQKSKKRKRMSSGEITLSPKRRQISEDNDVELITDDVNTDSSNSNHTTARKERKRKRTDSFEVKDSGISLTISSSSIPTTNLDVTSNTLSQKLSQSITSSSAAAMVANLSKLISANSQQQAAAAAAAAAAKLKKASNISPLTSPTLGKSIQLPNIALKYDKLASLISKGQKPNTLSMLSSSTMSEFEAAAAAAVAASAGGSPAAAVAAVVASMDSKRFAKPIKPGKSNTSNNGSKSPITLSVSSTPSSTTASRVGKVQSGSTTISSTSSGLVSPKILQQPAIQSMLPTSTTVTSSAAAAAAAAATAAAASKAILQKPIKKGSLTAVVDRLRQNAADGSSVLPGGQTATTTTTAPASTSPEISSATKPDSSKQTTPSKSANEKAKYFRSPDSQFTIKQSNSGLKMSITKNKPLNQSLSPSAADLISKFGPSGTGLFKSTNTKYTIPKIAKNPTTTASISSSTASTVANTSSSAITSPSSSSASIVGSTSPSPTKKSNNGIKSSSSLISKSSKSLLSASPTPPSPSGKSPTPGQKISPKSNLQPSPGGNNQKLFKNPDSIIFNKITPIGGGGGGQNRVAQALFKNYPNQNWPNSMDQPKMAVSSSDMYSPADVARISNSVSSSSDVSNKSTPTSTPSSPAECSPLPEAKNPPLIIPTEAIPESEPPASSSKDVDSSLEDYSKTPAAADSSAGFSNFRADQSADPSDNFKRPESSSDSMFYSKIPTSSSNEFPTSTSVSQNTLVSSNISEADTAATTGTDDGRIGSTE